LNTTRWRGKNNKLKMGNMLKILFDDYYVDEIVGTLGFVVTIIGFIVTIINLKKVKSATQKAGEAVQQVKDSISAVNTLSDVSAAIMILDEIKRLHRSKSWEITLDRYAHLRRSLSSIDHQSHNLSDNHHKCIQETILYLSELEFTVEKSLEAV
jgi:hypothetical protein